MLSECSPGHCTESLAGWWERQEVSTLIMAPWGEGQEGGCGQTPGWGESPGLSWKLKDVYPSFHGSWFLCSLTSLEIPPSILGHKQEPSREERADYLSSVQSFLSSWWQQGFPEISLHSLFVSGWKEVWPHPWGRENRLWATSGVSSGCREQRGGALWWVPLGRPPMPPGT